MSMKRAEATLEESAESAEPMTYERMIATMSATAGIVETSPEDVQKQILERVLSADTAESVFENTAGLMHGDDLLGVNIEIAGARYMRTGYTQGALPFYAIVDGTRLDTGEPVTFSCGAVTAVAQIFRWDTLGAFPLAAQLSVTERPTKGGYYPQFFVPIK